jgi:hypothetical protein
MQLSFYIKGIQVYIGAWRSMADYLIGLIFIAFVVIVFTIVQLKESRIRRLKKDYQRLEAAHSTMQEECIMSEFNRLQLERSLVGSKKWKDQLQEMKGILRSAKNASKYLSAKRLEHLEAYVAASIRADDPDLVFLGTFKPMEVYTLKERLVRMIDHAEFEIEIVSPWIKRQTWESIKVSIARFIGKGGSLRVFIRDEESDFSNRLGDDIREEVEAIGGEIILIKQLHAKIYLVDRREAIVTSANLTRGGFEGNIEAGIWSNNPCLLMEICKFVDNLYPKAKSEVID